MFESARVIASEGKLRADMSLAVDAPRLYDMILYLDGERTVAVNHELRTWFRLERSPFAVNSHLFSLMGREFKAKRITWSEEKSRDGVAGESKRIGQLSYVIEQDFGGTSVDVRYKAIVSLWPMLEPQLTIRWPNIVPLSTGLPEIDTKIPVTLLTPFPDRIVVLVERQYTGGQPTVETYTMTVDDVRQVPNPPTEFFALPTGYREQAPIVGAPGQ